mgnify:CR=1 FL=1
MADARFPVSWSGLTVYAVAQTFRWYIVMSQTTGLTDVVKIPYPEAGAWQ